MVIVDSNVWIRYLRDPKSAVGEELEKLLDAQQAAMVGVVLTEVLQGTRSEEDFEGLRTRLEAIPYLETGKETWVRTGRLARQLREQGKLTPITDLAVAALALEGDHSVYTLDEHFKRVPGLKLYEARAV